MQRQHYLQDDSTASLQTSVWWPTSTSASLSLSCCTSPKNDPLHYPCVHLKQSIPNGDSPECLFCCMQSGFWKIKRNRSQLACAASAFKTLSSCCCCSAAASDEELCAYSTGRTFKPLKSNVAAMTTVTSWKAGSQFQNKESARKRLDFSDFVFQLLYLIRGGTQINQRQYYYRLFCLSIAARRFHAISCYFMLFHAISSRSPLPLQRIGFSGSPALVDAVQQQ